MAVTTSRKTVLPVRIVFRPVWLCLLLVLLVQLAGLTPPVSVRYGVLLLTVAVFGLPHGAVDHLCLPRTRNTAVTARALATVGVLYLLLGGAYAVVWFLAPTAAFVFFILLTWYHWGQGDVYPLRVAAPGYHSDRLGTALTLSVRGAIPMCVPLVFFPDRYEAVAGLLVELFAAGDPSALAVAFTPNARVVVGAVVALLTLASLARGYWDSGYSRGWRLELSETAILWVFFAAVPPVLAIAVYFALWHSVRHMLRVAELDARTDDSLLAQLRQFTVEAAPMAAGALVVFGLLFVLVPQADGSVESVAGTYLVLLAILTLPHVVIVTWLDRAQQIWTPFDKSIQ